MVEVDVKLSPVVLGIFEDNRPPEDADLHAPSVPDETDKTDYWHGFSLRFVDRKKYNLYMKSLPNNKYAIGVDTRSKCDELLLNPPQSKEYYESWEIINELKGKINTAINNMKNGWEMTFEYLNSTTELDEYIEANGMPHYTSYVLKYC